MAEPRKKRTRRRNRERRICLLLKFCSLFSLFLLPLILFSYQKFLDWVFWICKEKEKKNTKLVKSVRLSQWRVQSLLLLLLKWEKENLMSALGCQKRRKEWTATHETRTGSPPFFFSFFFPLSRKVFFGIPRKKEEKREKESWRHEKEYELERERTYVCLSCAVSARRG